MTGDGEGTTGGVKTEHTLQPPPGEAAAEVVANISRLERELTIDRRRFTVIYGQQNSDFKTLMEIKKNLDRNDESFLRLASGQAQVAEKDLIAFQISMATKSQDLLSYIEAVDPTHAHNSKEKIKSAL